MTQNRTNQKLFFAQILLDGEPKLSQGDDVIHQPAIHEAIAESVAWQLRSAYRSLLAEILASNRIEMAQEKIVDAQGLAEFCSGEGRVIPEFNRLAQQEANTDRWLHRLLTMAAEADALTRDKGSPQVQNAAPSSQTIPLSQPQSEDKLVTLRQMHHQLTQLVDDLRSSIDEW